MLGTTVQTVTKSFHLKGLWSRFFFEWAPTKEPTKSWRFHSVEPHTGTLPDRHPATEFFFERVAAGWTFFTVAECKNFSTSSQAAPRVQRHAASLQLPNAGWSPAERNDDQFANNAQRNAQAADAPHRYILGTSPPFIRVSRTLQGQHAEKVLKMFWSGPERGGHYQRGLFVSGIPFLS